LPIGDGNRPFRVKYAFTTAAEYRGADQGDSK
jgi:hypothetical protein